MGLIALSEDWVPPKLLCREKELNKIGDIFWKVQNVYATGSRGVGKTVTAKTWLSLFPPKYQLYVKMSTKLDRTFRNILSDRGFKVKTKYSIADILNKLEKLYLVIDDAFSVYQKSSLWSFLHELHDSATDAVGNHKIMLVSTLPWHVFIKKIPPEVQSRYYFSPVVFGAYTVPELEMIYKQRAELVWTKIEDGVPKWLAAKTRRLGQDVRLGLRILRFAYQYNSKVLAEETIKKGWEVEKHRFIKEEVYEKLNPYAAFSLFCLALKISEKQNKKILGGIYSSELHYNIQMRAHYYGAPKLEAPFINYHLNSLQANGWISRESGVKSPRGAYIILNYEEPRLLVEVGKEMDWERILCMSCL